MIGTDADGMNIDTLSIILTEHWLMVLASPQAYRALVRPVAPQFLVRLLDIWIAYADRGEHYFSATAPDPNRPTLARKLRDLIATWTPPDLPAEITEAARALLRREPSGRLLGPGKSSSGHDDVAAALRGEQAGCRVAES